MSNYFEGFPREYIDFLWELRMNNNTQWFAENRERYNALVKDPMKLFSEEMTERLNSMGMGVTFTAYISRANRDIRFSKDKSPYKDRRWVVFNFGENRWQEKCCFYFEIAPEGYSCGMGLWDAGAAYMERYRRKLSAKPATVKKLDKKLKGQDIFAPESRMYKKNFAPEGVDKEIAHWYQYRNLGFTSEYKITDSLFDRRILDEVQAGFEFLKPFFVFFKDI